MQGSCSLALCDVFSLGACMFELCVGTPIDWSNEPYRSVREDRSPVVLSSQYSEEFCMLLTSMLQEDASDRWVIGVGVANAT